MGGFFILFFRAPTSYVWLPGSNYSKPSHLEIHSTWSWVLSNPSTSPWYVPRWFLSSVDSQSVTSFLTIGYPGSVSDVKQFCYLSLKSLSSLCWHSGEPSPCRLTFRWTKSIQDSSYRPWGTNFKSDLASNVITTCLITAADCWQRTKISRLSWWLLCTFTIFMIIFSMFMKGSYCQILLSRNFRYITISAQRWYAVCFKLDELRGKP